MSVNAAVSEDLTHEQQLDRLRVEVESLRRQLRQAQRLATMGTMTAMVAHEFNNILTPIVNYAQLASENPQFASKAVAKAADGGRRASRICNAILGLSSAGSESPQELPLAEVVEQAVSAMARDPQRDAIQLTIAVPAGLKLRTRSIELQHVLLNLLMNARAAVMERSAPRQIEVSADRKAGRAVIRVSDNGVGIEPENLSKVFEPFFTTRADKQGASQGHGLGLAVCRDIVASLGGAISVHSKPGKGATFTVDLPVT